MGLYWLLSVTCLSSTSGLQTLKIIPFISLVPWTVPGKQPLKCGLLGSYWLKSFSSFVTSFVTCSVTFSIIGEGQGLGPKLIFAESPTEAYSVVPESTEEAVAES